MSELEKNRKIIDEKDGQILASFEERMEAARKIAEYKRENNLSVLDAKRENEVLDKRMEALKNKELTVETRELFRKIMELSRRYQSRLLSGEDAGTHYVREIMRKCCPRSAGEQKIGYQGVPGSYGEQAAVEYFGEQAYSSYETFEKVMKALSAGEIHYGILPIENSSTGGITEVYDLLRKYGTFIVGEYKLKVEHCLLGLPDAQPSDIREVYSHPEGLAQSRDFLSQYEKWQQHTCLNTAVAAQLVAQSGDKSKAAVASRRCAELYGLKVLTRGVNFNKSNYTRFIVVSMQLETDGESNKISTYFSLPHVSGSLAGVLDEFSGAGLNLLKIESRPMYNKSWEYFFYIDFEGNLQDKPVQQVLGRVASGASYFEVLGNYKAAL